MTGIAAALWSDAAAILGCHDGDPDSRADGRCAGEDALRSMREQVAGSTASLASYAGRDVRSFALDVGVDPGYRITPRLQARLRVDLHSAEEYTEFRGGVALDYTFGGSGDNAPLTDLARLPR